MQLLESGLLKNLLLLNRRSNDGAQKRVPGASGAFNVTSFLHQRKPSEPPGAIPVDELDQRIAVWLRDCEAIPYLGEGTPPHVTLHQRQLRALLHIVDGETDSEDEPDRRARVHGLWTSTCRVLLGRLAREAESPLRRAITATVARALDALLRDGAADPADVVLFAAARTTRADDLAVLAEACMQPDASRLLRSYARFAADRDPEGRAPLRALELPRITRLASSRRARARNALSNVGTMVAPGPEGSKVRWRSMSARSVTESLRYVSSSGGDGGGAESDRGAVGITWASRPASESAGRSCTPRVR